jgi:cytochrome c biogenesis protein CcmG, thiol:disulfide interchange protein DsbE
MSKWLRLGLPLAVLLGLAVVLALGLQTDPRQLPSARAGKPAPSFKLPLLQAASGPTSPSSSSTASSFSSEAMQGRVWVMNVFASWCVACVAEHPTLVELARDPRVRLIGLAYKDKPEDTRRWLARHGNPYAQVAVDITGDVGIDYGVYGVPETYLIDATGVIRARHTGPITVEFINRQLMPLLSAGASANETR